MIIMLVGSAVWEHMPKSHDIEEDIICWSTCVRKCREAGVQEGWVFWLGCPVITAPSVLSSRLTYLVVSQTPPLGGPPGTSKFTRSMQILDVLPHPSRCLPHLFPISATSPAVQVHKPEPIRCPSFPHPAGLHHLAPKHTPSLSSFLPSLLSPPLSRFPSSPM